MEGLVSRLAGPQDIPAIVELVESVYRGDKSRLGWTTEADLLDGQRTDQKMIAEMLADPNSVFLLTFLDSKLIASVYLQKRDSYGYLGMLSVDVSLQNLKLGRRLLEASEDLIKNEWRLTEVRMRVFDSRKTLIEWYERRGYHRTGNKIEFPIDVRTGIPKVEGLIFDELAKTL